MEDLFDRLQRERDKRQGQLLEVEDNDRAKMLERVSKLKETYEEMELVAAAAGNDTTVLPSDFYAQYLVVCLLDGNL